ncbi:hypothetical protein GQ600_493 [Phytophthora cactorum]|nr:hypothetical protein GQ600_493 [Phytophthora cactorum]
MVSTTSILALTAAVATTVEYVQAHGYIAKPAPSWKDKETNDWVVEIEPQWKGGWDQSKGDEGLLSTFKELSAANNYKDVRSLMDGNPCTARTAVSRTPRIWLDDKMVLQNDDCQSAYGDGTQATIAVFKPVDYSSCASGGCLLRFYWLALHVSMASGVAGLQELHPSDWPCRWRCFAADPVDWRWLGHVSETPDEDVSQTSPSTGDSSKKSDSDSPASKSDSPSSGDSDSPASKSDTPSGGDSESPLSISPHSRICSDLFTSSPHSHTVMVSTTSIVVVASAIAMSANYVQAHGYVENPESEFKDKKTSEWIVQIDPQWKGDWDNAKGDEGLVALYKELKASNNAKDIRTLLDSDTSLYGADCGYTNPDIWLDDKMVLQNDDCQSAYGDGTQETISVFKPVDYSSCASGGCMFRFYWLALQRLDGKTYWQVYKNCIPLSGPAGGGASQITPSTGDGSGTSQTSPSSGEADGSATTAPTSGASESTNATPAPSPRRLTHRK